VPRLFALDQNFPQPIVALLAEYLTEEAELVPLGDIDRRLPDMENDWELLLSLHHDGRPWDGLITTDTSMLSLERELAVLMQTRLTLVAAEEAGHDPLRATGLLLLHLPGICKATTPARAQIWHLRAPGRLPHLDPWDQLGRVARHRSTSARRLYRNAQLSASELARDPLAK